MWMQFKVGMQMRKSAEMRKNNNIDNLPLLQSTHLVSVGSEKVMLAIHLHSDRSLGINLLRPSQDMNENKSKKLEKSANAKKNDGVLSIREEVRIQNKEVEKSSNKENINQSNIMGGNGEGLNSLAESSKNKNPNIYTRGLLRTVNKMGIFTSSLKKKEKNQNILNILQSSMKTKNIKVPVNRWCHLCFSIKNTENFVEVLITLDGLEQETIEIPIAISAQLEKSQKLNLLCIGSNRLEEDTNKIRYSLSNVVLFKAALYRADLIASLFAVGPDCVNFVQCQTKNNSTNYGLLDFRKKVCKISDILMKTF